MKYWLLAATAVGLPVALTQTPQPTAVPQAPTMTPATSATPEEVASVPLAFTANQGQMAPEALYSAVGGPMQAYFTKDGMRFRLIGQKDVGGGGTEELGANLFLSFVGSPGATDIVASEPLAARTNVLRGGEQGFITDIPMYGALEYRRLYEGIDLAVHNDRGDFEYDFLLEPGIDPAVIGLAFAGAEGVAVSPEGDLWVDTHAGRMIQAAPVSWQVTPEGAELPVDSRYVERADGTIGFELGDLDDALATVIDPRILWATYLGGASCERVTGLAMDEALYVYGTGMTMGNDMPVTPGAFDTVDDWRNEGVAFKLSPDGSTLIWCTYFGGDDQDHPEGLALAGGSLDPVTSDLVDRSLVIVGSTSSTDFPVTAGTFQPWKGAGADAFVIRIAPNGDALDWGTYYGDRDVDGAWAVDTNGAGEVLVAGETQSVAFWTPGAFQTAKGSHKDGFVAKIAADGSAVLWSSFFGGSQDDWILGADFDDVTDEVVVAGTTLSPDFPTTPGAFHGTYGGGGDAFAARITPDGSALVFSTLLSGGDVDVAMDVEADGSGRTYVVGYTDSADYHTTPGAFQTTYGGMRDGFVTSIEPGGQSLVFSSFYGGSRLDEVRGFDIDFLGVSFITGTTESPNLPMAGFPIEATKLGWSDVFLAQVERDGAFLEFSSYVGAGDIAEGEAVAHDFATGSLVAGGRTRSGFPVTPGAYDTTYNFGSGDFFVVRLEPDPCPTAATVQTLGTGCGATMTSTNPVMGKPLQVDIVTSSPNTPVFVFRSGAAAVGTPLQIEGCDVFIDFGFWMNYVLVTDAAGMASDSLVVPNDSARCGMNFVLQALVIDPAAGPLSFGAISNGLLEVMGS